MDALEVALGLIKQFESCRLKAYPDSAGVPTIGWGHTEGIQLGDQCTQEQADAWLMAEAKTAQLALCALSPTVAELVNEQAALIDFVYNEGIGHYRGSTLRKLVDAGDFKGAALAIQSWVYAGGVKLRGLMWRREAEAALLYKEDPT